MTRKKTTRKKTTAKKVVNKRPQDPNIGYDKTLQLSNNLEIEIPDKVLDEVVKKRKAKKIILQQCTTKSEAFDKHKAHFLIWKDGTITKGLGIDENGEHCEGFNDNSIGIVLEGKFNRPQQKALMNVLYGIFKTLKKKVEVQPYHMFVPGSVNPNLNIRSVMREYTNNYETKRVVKVAPRASAKTSKLDKIK